MAERKPPKPGKREFGGRWTVQKLEALEKYLPRYTTILTKNPAAKHLRTFYVDAFAGTGKMEYIGREQQNLFNPEEEAYLSGSARRALKVSPEFDRYILIENDGSKRGDLEQLKTDFPEKADRIEIHTEDANTFLIRWCSQTDWRKWRAVVFLDPFAMSVPWSTIDAIAKTKCIDLWYLFPCGAFNRLLTNSGSPPAAWSKAITNACGTGDWRDRFYEKKKVEGLFEAIESDEKVTDFDGIGSFIHERLAQVFTQVANKPLILKNSTNTPIFMLFFAAGNPKGAAPAIKIANWIIEHGGDENKYRMD